MYINFAFTLQKQPVESTFVCVTYYILYVIINVGEKVCEVTMRIEGENGKISFQVNISCYRVCVHVLVLYFSLFFILTSHACPRLHLLMCKLSLSLFLTHTHSLSLTHAFSLSLVSISPLPPSLPWMVYVTYHRQPSVYDG